MPKDKKGWGRTPLAPPRQLSKHLNNQTPRDRYVAWLNQLQSPDITIIKKGTTQPTAGLPMLPAKAALLLAVYDGLIPASPEHQLNIMFHELLRNPRKGRIPVWPISDA
jgi:hypothetical protein